MISRRKFGAVAASVLAGAAAAFGLSKREPDYEYKYQMLEGLKRPNTDKHGDVYCHMCRTHVRVIREHLMFTYDENGLEKTEFANLHCRQCNEKLVEMEIVMCTNWDHESPEDRAHRRLINTAWTSLQGG